MDLRRLSVREFRSQMNKLDEPVQVGDGYWFPTQTLLEEYIGSGDREHKPLPPSGESDHKTLPSDEATHVAASSEASGEGRATESRGERAGERSQPRAPDPTVATRAMQQANRDAILRRLQRGTRRDT